MSSSYRWSVAVAAALALAAPSSAQQYAPQDAGQALVTSSTLFAPPPASLRIAPDSAAKPFVVPVVRGGQPRENENVALMIVGGAALVVGAVIDGDAGTVIMIGGGVVGLIGLYRYLR